MAKTEHYFTQFLPEGFYHVYNRTVDKKPMFKNEGNYIFFLKKYDQYLSGVLTTYSYALCGNHFHFGVKVKTETELIEFRKQNNYEGRFDTTHLLVAERFRLLFLSYSKAFNKAHDRVGSLFQTPFKRCLIDTEEKIIRLIFYHHSNPQRHGLCTDFRTYKWTSYPRYLLDSASKLPKAEVFELLGNREQFILCHNELSKDLKEEEEWMIED